MGKSDEGKTPEANGITKTGRRKTVWLHEDEAEALRDYAYEHRLKESEIIRTALREFLEIED